MFWNNDQNNQHHSADRRRIRHVNAFVSEVRNRQTRFCDATIDQLSSEFEKLREQAIDVDAAQYDELFVDGMVVITQAVQLTHGFQLHDVQVAGAAAAASGAIIEMQTGEGKTIVCGSAALLRSIFDLSVHVATTTDYLAERDFEENQNLFTSLATSANVLRQSASVTETRRAYRCRITYGPGYLFGFDYLRDQVKIRSAEEIILGRDVLERINGFGLDDQLLQHTHQTIIVDEADCVLLDEATTPLILSQPVRNAAECSVEPFLLANRVAQDLRSEVDFVIDTQARRIALTESGSMLAYDAFRERGDLQLNRPWSVYLENALYANQFLTRDEDYVVNQGRVQLVDQNTGRILEDRQLRGGLHQAVESKEDVDINPPNETSARLTRQRFFSLYERVCGMTGTICGNEKEVEHFYRAAIAPFKPHQTSQRFQFPTRFFASWDTKLAAIADDAVQRHRTGQPILIGTRTIRESNRVDQALKANGIKATVLNGVQDEDEAKIVARAGVLGAITIATNMAGRGTDIKLTDEARAAGGLHVICTQHHTSQRIDRQLIGRSARQGDPGSYQFFVSGDDELFVQHAEQLGSRIRKSAEKGGESCRDFSPEILRLQNRLELEQFQLRRSLVRQDQWMDQIRETMACQ